MNLKIFDNLDELYRSAAQLFIERSAEAVARNGQFTVALSGGSSPKAIFQLLATEDYYTKIDWDRWFIFWVDERWVPLDDDKSNAKMTIETLLDRVPVNRAQVFPMYRDHMEPAEFAKIYENQMREVLGDSGIFDLVLLGMGDDGHTASLFPNQPILNEKEKWVDAYYLQSQDMFRITLTEPVINRAEHLLVVAFGEAKKHALQQVLTGAYNPTQYPIQLIDKEKPGFQFFTDKAAVGE